MNQVILTIFIASLLALTSLAWTAKKHVTSNAILTLRAGKSKRAAPKSNKPMKTKPKKKSVQDDDDDDEDDEDYIPQKKSSKKTSPSNRRRSKKQSNSLIPWGAVTSTSASAFGSVRARLEDIAKKGQSAYKDVYRRAKVLKSSAFEGMLLKATWPGNEPVPQDILNEIIRGSIPAFKYSQSASDDDPYHMTLHKIWTKLLEKDWRTVTKSLFLLHSISRDSSDDACAEFADAIRVMSKTRNPKRPDHKYFTMKMITLLDKNGKPYDTFIKSYATYVIYRMKNFSSKFNELQEIDESMSEKEVVQLIKNAQQLVAYGLSVTVEKKQINKITAQVSRIMANDLRDLWKHLITLISSIVEGDSKFGGEKANASDLASILQYHKDHQSDIKNYLSSISKSFASYKLKISSEIDGELSIDTIDSKLKTVISISGGYTPKLAEDDENDEEGDDADEADDEDDVAESTDEDEDDEDDSDSNKTEEAKEEDDSDEDDDDNDEVKDAASESVEDGDDEDDDDESDQQAPAKTTPTNKDSDDDEADDEETESDSVETEEKTNIADEDNDTEEGDSDSDSVDNSETDDTDDESNDGIDDNDAEDDNEDSNEEDDEEEDE